MPVHLYRNDSVVEVSKLCTGTHWSGPGLKEVFSELSQFVQCRAASGQFQSGTNYKPGEVT